jgi:hypothetical protein
MTSTGPVVAVTAGVITVGVGDARGASIGVEDGFISCVFEAVTSSVSGAIHPENNTKIKSKSM